MVKYLGGQKLYNPTLTNASIGYRDSTLVGRRIITPIDKSNSKRLYLPVYDNAHHEITDNRRVPGANFNEFTSIVDFQTIKTEQHAASGKIPEELLENLNQQVPMDIRMKTRKEVDYRLELELEGLIATFMQTNGVGTFNYENSPGNKWDSPLTSTPVADIQLAIDTVEDACGIRPNTMLISMDVWRILRTHPDILAYLGENTQIKLASFEVLKKLFIDGEDPTPSIEILQGKSYARNPLTNDLYRLWSKSVVLTYTVKGTLDTPEPTFAFLPITQNKKVKEAWIDDIDSYKMYVKWEYGIQSAFPKAGALLYDVLT